MTSPPTRVWRRNRLAEETLCQAAVHRRPRPVRRAIVAASLSGVDYLEGFDVDAPDTAIDGGVVPLRVAKWAAIEEKRSNRAHVSADRCAVRQRYAPTPTGARRFPLVNICRPPQCRLLDFVWRGTKAFKASSSGSMRRRPGSEHEWRSSMSARGRMKRNPAGACNSFRSSSQLCTWSQSRGEQVRPVSDHMKSLHVQRVG